MKSVDLDRNGTIDNNEFLTASLSREKILSKQNLEIAFKNFDKDGSGKISLNEIAQIFNLAQNTLDQELFKNIMK